MYIDNDKAYFLHLTQYRDNSAIVHFFTESNGKVSFLVSGLKAKKNPKRPFLQPCKLLSINYHLRTGLSKLDSIDFASPQIANPDISHFMLYQYANELLLSILPDHLTVQSLFIDYQKFMSLLNDNKSYSALRHIELSLIVLFSGLPNIERTQDTNEPIQKSHDYWFYTEGGLFSCQQSSFRYGIKLDGEHLLAFIHTMECYLSQQPQRYNEVISQAAKVIATQLINQLLNGRRLKTRKVFITLQDYL